MLQNIFIISITMSVVILALFVISPMINKRYTARWRYFVWFVIALRLIIPYRFELPKAPVNIPTNNYSVIMRTDGTPLRVMDTNELPSGEALTDSADYAPIISLEDLLFFIWIVGATAFLEFNILCYCLFKRKIRPCLIKIHENIYKCSRIASPMMIGFLKPMILLPETKYTDEELEVIIKHEMTHFKRRDIWYKLLLLTANAIHWFNPIIYIMMRMANRDLEYSCDDLVIKDCDTEYKKQYSMTILKSMDKGTKTTLSTYFNGGTENE